MVILPHLVGDMDICCDFAEHDSCPKEGAAWVMHTVRCACGQGGARLSCGPCKDQRIESEDGVKCGGCGYVTIPARLAYSMIEPLK
jgi:hypothetical protein